MIELHFWEQLVAIADCGTISAASEKLHLTQPALSRSMKRLEELLGVPIIIVSVGPDREQTIFRVPNI